MASLVDSKPFVFVIDFSSELTEQQTPCSELQPEVAWILYDKTNQQIVTRGYHKINLDYNEPKSQIYSSEYFLKKTNQLFENYHYPEIVVENQESLWRLNTNHLSPNLQLEKASNFSVVTDYQEKTDLPFKTLEDVLHNLGQISSNQRLNDLSVRTNKILEYYLNAIARKEREQPYSQLPIERKSTNLNLGKIIAHYFLGLTLMGVLLLGLNLFLSGQIISAITHSLIGVVTCLFLFKHLRK